MSTADELARRRTSRRAPGHAHLTVVDPPTVTPEPEPEGRKRPITARAVEGGVSLNIAGWFITLSPAEARQLVVATSTALGDPTDPKELS